MVACADQKGAQALAKLGADTSKTLGDFYDSLAQDTTDYWELATFGGGIYGHTPNENDKKTYLDRMEALNRRARMARALSDTYGALSRMASYDASGEVKNAAVSFSQAIMKLPVMPKTSVDPSDLFGTLAGDIAAWVQTQELRRGSGALLLTVEKLRQFFEREQAGYNSIITEFAEYQKGITRYLIDHKLVSTWPLLKIPPSLGLNWVNEKAPVDDANTRKALEEIAYFRVDNLAQLSLKSGDNLKTALAKLADNHRQFVAGSPLTLDQTLEALQKTQTYLDEIAKLKAAKNTQGGKK
jgi:hypothetical protein